MGGEKLLAKKIEFNKIVTGLCLFTLSIGILVLIGWAFDINSFKSILPGFISMKVNTALGFILLSLTSLLLKSERPKTWQLIAAGILGFIVFQIGLLTLLEYYYRFDFGIDELFFKDVDGLAGRFPPGRLAPITATEFLILPVAIALGSNPFKQLPKISEFLIIASFLIAFQAFIGYLMGITYTFGSAYYTQMAVHTAVGFVTLCLSLVLARPNEGFLQLFFLKTSAGKSMRQLIVAAILIPPLVQAVKAAGQKLGFYDSDFGVMVQIMGNTVFLLYVIIRNTGDLHKNELSRQKADLELQEREERFRLLAESLPQLIWSAKANGEEDYFNSQWVTYTGENANHFSKSDWNKIIHPDDLEKVFRKSNEAPLKFYEAEYRIKNAEGIYEWFLSRTIYIRDGDNKILKQLTTATNINSQKILQEEKTKIFAEQTAALAIRKSESRLRAIFANAFDGIVSLDSLGRVTDWNPQAEKIFGYRAQEVVGRSLLELIIPKYQTLPNFAVYDQLLDLSEQNLNHLMKVEVMRSDKSHFPAQIVITPVRLDEITVYTAFIADITEQVKTETELRDAREQAENGAKLKSEFLANMSHEIRTPLNGVIGMTDLLLETQMTEQQQKFTKIIQGSGNSLLTIINDILDFSKIEAGKLDLEIIDFDLITLIEGQAELLVARAREKNLSLMTYIDPSIPVILKGDPGRIGQILLNLIGNAIKFTQAGSVTVRALQHSTDKNRVVFSVHDTGLGLSPTAQKKLFQAFTQADGSTARKYGGTGLGLSISKRLVTLMNGVIGVESAEGQGSTFWFELTLESGHPQGEAPTPLELLAQTSALIVDDDAAAGEIIQHYLKNWGLSSTLVSDGPSALEKISKEKFNLLIIDRKMPGMTGIDLADQIKKNDPECKTPMIMVSAYDRLDQNELDRQNSFSAHLTKPIRQSELFNAIVNSVQTDQSKLSFLHARRPDKSQNHQVAKTAKILVAEDNTVNQMVTLMQLKNLGYSATAVANGAEVLSALKDTKFDLILMDCQMPEMDGFQATRAIRELEKRHGGSIAIIALTANAMKEDEEACLNSGMNDYLAKPIKKEQLNLALLKWLPQKKLAI